MRGDFSKLRYPSRKNYTSVLQQQGRVALDADANEQALIDDHLRALVTADTIGRSGGPAKHEGFEISATLKDEIHIGKGRYYVDGLLVHNEHHRRYTNQPFLVDSGIPAGQTDADLLNSLQNGSITAVQVELHVWQRLVTALDDPSLLEPALGQADTTARLQTVWQVVATGFSSYRTRAITGSVTVISGSANVSAAAGLTAELEAGQRVMFASDTSSTPYEIASIAGDGSTFTLTQSYAGSSGATTVSIVLGNNNCGACAKVEPERHKLGRLSAQTSGSGGDCNCQPTPAAGYRGLENQLYRVEIHDSGDESTATFKWSRENGSVVVPVSTAPSGSQVWVDRIGPDANLGFKVNDWVELSDDSNEFGLPPNQPGGLYQIQSITPVSGGYCVTMDRTVTLDPTLNARMRRWEQFGSSATANGVPLQLSGFELENGIEIQFSAGHYRSGDYWTIPARTATGDIEWPPAGSESGGFVPPHFTMIHTAPLAYIEWSSATGTFVATDCRTAFSPLGEVDLAFHNRHLHGWGIVCGLKVTCGPDRSRVTVKKGYAIDCKGHDIRMKCDVPLDLVSMAEDGSLIDADGNGDVSLILQSDGTFAVEAEDKSKEDLGAFFQNTIWWDFAKKCIQPLLTFISSEFKTGAGTGTSNSPIGPGQQRLDTFLPFFYQRANPIAGESIYVSIEEDQILRRFYDALKELLSSCTFCGLFDNARPFPDYPFTALNIHSLFGSGNHGRLRIGPHGKHAYTVGTNNMIQLYDLTQGIVTANAAFPYSGQGTVVVKDVALSQSGEKLCAIAQVGSNSAVAWADVAAGTLNWTINSASNFGQVQVLNGVQLDTLATREGLLCATATGEGGGLYAIQFGSPFPETPTFSYENNKSFLFGHLIIDTVAGVAYMTAAFSTAAGRYNSIVAQPLDGSQASSFTLDDAGSLFGTFEDDIAVAVNPAAGTTYLYVTIEPPAGQTNKQLLIFDRSSRLAAEQSQPAMIDLGQVSPVDLAYNSTNAALLVSYTKSNQIGVVDTTKNVLTSVQLPSELFPRGIAVSPDFEEGSQTVYVVHIGNSTIAAIPTPMLDNAPTAANSFGTPQLQQLADYRTGVLDAFADLLGLAIESLKDCFCELFLVDCPECSPADKIYLGCIQIKNSQVYRICNLSRRRYVKSFPTYGYWLSLIPVLPTAKWLIEKVCCMVLPDFFRNFEAGQRRVNEKDRVSYAQYFSVNSYLRGINLSAFRTEQMTKFSMSGKTIADSLRTQVFNQSPVAMEKVPQTDIVGKDTSAVTQNLQKASVTVDAVEPYDPTTPGSNAAAILGAPANIPAGSHVVLYEQNGVVQYYTLTPKTTPVVQGLASQVQKQQATMTGLNVAQQTAETAVNESHRLIVAQQATIAAQEQKIATLQASLTAVQSAQTSRDQQFATVQASLQELQKAQTARDKDLSALQATVKRLSSKT